MPGTHRTWFVIIFVCTLLSLVIFRQSNAQVSTLKVQYFTTVVSATIDAIEPDFNIVNTGSTSVPLTELAIRYYFTRDSLPQPFVTSCWYTSLPGGCASIVRQVVTLPTPVNGADSYLEVTFTSGSVPANGETGEILLGFRKQDWSNFDQTNDYSFRNTSAVFSDWNQITLYRNGSLVWGTPPGGAQTPSPSPTALPSPTATPRPSPTPTPGTGASASPVSSSLPGICLNITFSPSFPQYGDSVTYTCGTVSGATRYDFQYAIYNRQTLQLVTSGNLNAGSAGSNISQPLAITQDGVYKTVCRACITSGFTESCTPFEPFQ